MITDTPFDDAKNVFSIGLRLHPLDVGFDLRAERMPVEIPPDGSGTLRASYATRDGERRVVDGPREDVIRHLRAHGYDVRRLIPVPAEGQVTKNG